jgi:hypothetical protein
LNPASTPQPDPTPGAKVVLTAALCYLDQRSSVDRQIHADLIARAEMGKAKYGTLLMTHNGRDALIDLQQEVLDAVMYAAQYLEECSRDDQHEHSVRLVLLLQTLGFLRNVQHLLRRRDAR